MEMNAIEEAESHAKHLALPWTYFAEEDQIYSQEDDIEYGDYGSIISTGKEIIAEFLGQERSEEIVKAVNSLPDIIAEARKWQAIAIEDHARKIYPFSMPMWDNLPEEDYSKMMFSGKSEIFLGKRSYRQLAASELGTEAGQWVRMTDERRDAIQWAIELIGDCPAGDALREMLEECK